MLQNKTQLKLDHAKIGVQKIYTLPDCIQYSCNS